MGNVRQCKGTTTTGAPCSATPRPGRDYCPWHDPALATERASWKVKAGQSKSNRTRAKKKLLASAMDLNEVDAALCLALKDVLAGELEPGIGTAAASIARTITTVRAAGEHEERLARLERELGIQEGRTA